MAFGASIVLCVMKIKLFLNCTNVVVALVSIFVFSLFPGSLFGDGITIQSVSAAALQHSIELKKQQKKLDIQNTEIQAAYAETLPKLDTQYTLNYADYSVSGRDALANIVVGVEPVSVYPVRPSRYKSGFDTTLTQMLYSGGKISANIDLNKLKYEQEKIDYALLKESILTSSLESFWGYRLAFQENQYYHYCLASLALKKHSSDLKKIQGLTSHYQDIELELASLNTHEDAEKARLQCQTKFADLQLMTQLNLDDVTPIIFMQTGAQLERFWTQLTTGLSDEDLTLDRQRLEIQMRQQNQIIEDSRFLPELLFQSGINYFNSDDSRLDKAAGNLKYGSLYAEITVKWNWFNGFKDKARSEKAALEKELADLDFSQQKIETQVRLEQLSHSVETAFTTVKRTEKSLQLARQLLADKERLRETGNLSEEQVFESQELFKKSALNFEKSIVEVELAIIKWCQKTHRVDDYIVLKGVL